MVLIIWNIWTDTVFIFYVTQMVFIIRNVGRTQMEYELNTYGVYEFETNGFNIII